MIKIFQILTIISLTLSIVLFSIFIPFSEKNNKDVQDLAGDVQELSGDLQELSGDLQELSNNKKCIAEFYFRNTSNSRLALVTCLIPYNGQELNVEITATPNYLKSALQPVLQGRIAISSATNLHIVENRFINFNSVEIQYVDLDENGKFIQSTTTAYTFEKYKIWAIV